MSLQTCGTLLLVDVLTRGPRCTIVLLITFDGVGAGVRILIAFTPYAGTLVSGCVVVLRLC